MFEYFKFSVAKEHPSGSFFGVLRNIVKIVMFIHSPFHYITIKISYVLCKIKRTQIFRGQYIYKVSATSDIALTTQKNTPQCKSSSARECVINKFSIQFSY